ncbi:hypothetical protein EG346_02990 [Chryseobacterium carnipullorum]|uniref:Natural product, GG-Bacteroidales family n=1 Tax=Chryseobacterium carnipullorum TaxID=1124835 RepID=A0A1M7LY43_CHRCU|nr:class I lanthipeptide [Chryseobacterium carnipullorum]MDN5423065.1 class I lanthipeptide [Chryseobacterium sp.]AZA47208.1 hypothetical protein EG346_02990 [Chryseobacterium carnipullorum]AZA66555.1 hypothetical protein EG345_19090 [Chryseobacterium carnipullorum]MDN5476046.1 class I lanthipeptide [Chryseobacterium sp.]SHM82747.1 hypothetical protein SAMN05444360_11888 [Chryseobacterium carnipullorum]
MKKLKLNPLSLDKQTIALLDEKQLQEIKGGKTGFSPCPAGATTCDPNGSGGGSTGCGAGTSACPVQS